MKLPFAVWFPALVILGVLQAARKGEEMQAASGPFRLLSPPSVARCTPFRDGSCSACTNCKYCQWCNANPENHCTTCLSSRNGIATAK